MNKKRKGYRVKWNIKNLNQHRANRTEQMPKDLKKNGKEMKVKDNNQK